MSDRTFRLVSVGNKKVSAGRYTGKTPMQAARKAFNRYCREKGVKTCKHNFVIKEITQGSKGKEYEYVGQRKKLSSPEIIERGGEEIKIQYTSVVRSA